MAAQTDGKLRLEDLTDDEWEEMLKAEETYPYYQSLPPQEKEEKLLKYIAGLRAEKQSQKAIESYFEAMKKFEPKDRELYDLKKWKFDDRFLKLMEYMKKDELKEKIPEPLEEVLDGVFRFPMLEEKFAIRLLDEVAYFQEWCKKTCKHIVRPNSMNNYGAILDHFGFKTALSDLVSSVIQPLAARLYRAEFAKKYGLDSHHGFLVEYETGKDTYLNFHRDDSGGYMKEIIKFVTGMPPKENKKEKMKKKNNKLNNANISFQSHFHVFRDSMSGVKSFVELVQGID